MHIITTTTNNNNKNKKQHLNEWGTMMFTHSLVIFAVLISLVSMFLTMENLQIRVGMIKSLQVLESTPSNTQNGY